MLRCLKPKRGVRKINNRTSLSVVGFSELWIFLWERAQVC